MKEIEKLSSITEYEDEDGLESLLETVTSEPPKKPLLKREPKVVQTPIGLNELFFDYSLLQNRYLKAVQNCALTDDSLFEFDDDDDLPIATPITSTPFNPPSISLPPQSAPPFASTSKSSESGDDTLLTQNESKLQQSMSNPCSDGSSRKEDSVYRRFKSEGSSNSNIIDEPINGTTPVPLDSLPAKPNGTRFALTQQDSVINPAITKQSHTEQVTMMHTLKTKLSKYQLFIDRAVEAISDKSDEKISEGCTIIIKLMRKAWSTSKVSVDLAGALCDYMREREYFEKIIKIFISQQNCELVRLACGKVVESIMSSDNRDYIVNKNYLKRLMLQAMKLTRNPDQQRLSTSLMEHMFNQSTSTSLRLIEYGVLDHLILMCTGAKGCKETSRHVSLAFANLALFSCSDGKKKIIQKKVPDWLFLLASQQDDLTRYYACLAICSLASAKQWELDAAVSKSGTLGLVEPFLASMQAVNFAHEHFKHTQGREREWLSRLLPLLKARKEARMTAAFHFTMEAVIKKEQNKLEVFQEIGAIQALKEVASSPNEVAAKFASEALTVIGEEVPYKLAQQVPNWTTTDVKYWVRKIGFEEYVDKFAKHMVDGDLLLHLNENDLLNDIGMSSGLHRKRFMRELESLKIAADYSSVDESNLDQFLMNLSPELSVYTYQMLTNGVNRSLLSSLTDDIMQNACGITNPIHRLKLKQAFENAKHPDDVEVAMLSKQIDVFISYRRSTGNQLASLIKVLLQLRGYKVFIDVDKLYAGKFDSSLLKNIQAAKHFILVLTPNSLDRLLNDDNCEDWVHKELKCAFEHQKNIIPIFDTAFEFPAKEDAIPSDIRNITKYNGVKWVHDYQDACMAKVVRFIECELNRNTPTTKEFPTLSRKPISHRTWTNTTRKARAEPSTPTFSERPSSVRRKIQTSASTVSDRTN